MNIQIVAGDRLTINIHPLTWFVLPYHDIITPFTDNYGWLCFGLVVKTASKQKIKEWSDDEVIREIKTLEKEVEAQKKSKAKTVVKVKRG